MTSLPVRTVVRGNPPSASHQIDPLELVDLLSDIQYARRFADFTALEADTTNVVDDNVIVEAGTNGKPELGKTVAAGTYTADGSLVRDLTGSGLQWVSYRREFSSLAEMLADPRTGDDLPVGTTLTIPSIAAIYQIVTSGGNLGLTNAGGRNFDVLYGDVRSWGAKGDGVTDDTTALQTAFSLGGRICIPAGNYLIKTKLSVVSATDICGDGRTKTRITATGCSGIFSADGNQHVKISGLEIVGDLTANTYGIHVINNPRGITINDCYIRSFGTAGNGAGVFLTWNGVSFNMWGAKLSNVVVESCGRGFVLDHTQATTLVSCISRLCKGDPLYTNVSSVVSITGGAYENARTTDGATASIALHFTSTDNISVSGVYLENCIDSLIKLDGCAYASFSGVLVNNTTGAGNIVDLVASEHNVFSGIRVEGLDASGIVGISLDATSNYNTFIGVRIEEDGSTAAGSVQISDAGSSNTFLNTRGPGTSHDKLTVNGPITASGSLASGGSLTAGVKSQAVGNGFAVGSGLVPTHDVYLLTATASVASSTVTAISSGVDGQSITIVNNSAFSITLRNAANTRLAGDVNFIMAQNNSVTLKYVVAIGLWIETGRAA
ncbi:hypothetical protein DEM26_18255 [Thioclava sp. NG1]|uniref:glycosyl hydrolase family 28-related protein n=1 Tax=Thioclava sp. NG1 TaxID=2182426 RepID=UPI000D606CA2|nr:glycosyl hydrolase family 28-related protein [Thioclava sp. NG1]PWE48491.1 hypothetical protein DEM26_18255 [Thioclava sp. NG1]